LLLKDKGSLLFCQASGREAEKSELSTTVNRCTFLLTNEEESQRGGFLDDWVKHPYFALSFDQDSC
jgi:hypothetical protein